jgi:hypothetical protein
MFTASKQDDKNAIRIYTVYYTKKVPQELEAEVIRDRFMSLVKEGLSEVNGILIIRLTLTINGTDSTSRRGADNSRVTNMENLLRTLSREQKIEFFVRHR